MISGFDGAVIKKIEFSDVIVALVGNFDNSEGTAIVVESRNGTLSAISLPSGTRLWGMKLHLTELNPVGYLYSIPECDDGPVDILITINDTITLIKPTTGLIIFNRSISNLFLSLGKNNSQVSASCSNFTGKILKFTWTKPISVDLNNDSKKEIIIGVSAHSYQLRCTSSQANHNSRSSLAHVSYFESTDKTSFRNFCVLLVLDLKTGNTIEYLNLSADGFAYLTFKTYKIVIRSDVFIFLYAWLVQESKGKYTPVIIRFSSNSA